MFLDCVRVVLTPTQTCLIFFSRFWVIFPLALKGKLPVGAHLRSPGGQQMWCNHVEWRTSACKSEAVLAVERSSVQKGEWSSMSLVFVTRSFRWSSPLSSHYPHTTTTIFCLSQYVLMLQYTFQWWGCSVSSTISFTSLNCLMLLKDPSLR